MEPRRVRAKTSPRPGLRSVGCPGEAAAHLAHDTPSCDVDLPHHIMLEIMSFLDARSIVRGRRLSRAFRSDAPALVDTLQFDKGQKFPSAKTIQLFPKVKEVKLDGDRQLVHAAAAGLRGCASPLRLDISLCHPDQLQKALSKTATKNLCALPLTELETRRVCLEFPARLQVPAWRTLEKLVMNEAYIDDNSLANLLASIPAGPLPLRHLDLSRNLFGDVRPLARALRSFPDLETLEISAGRLFSDGAELIIDTLLNGACPKLRTLDISLNFVEDGVLDHLAGGLGRAGHGLQNLRRLGIGGRFSPFLAVTSFDTLGSALAAGSLPLLEFLHLQGDVGPPQVGPLLRKFKLGRCSNLVVVKVERSTPPLVVEDPDVIEDAIHSMLELVTSSSVPCLQQMHVLGMNLSEGLEMEKDDRTAFYTARNKSTFHHLAVAGGMRGVMVYV